MMDREDFFKQVAELAATRSTCIRAQVGCVLVQYKNIISTGYNGAPPGQPHCTDVGCDELLYSDQSGEVHTTGCRRAIHAEANALAWAARMGHSTLGATLFTTHEPCGTCARLLVSAGIH